MSIIYNNNRYTQIDNRADTILGSRDMRKPNVPTAGNIKSRTTNGGFVAWPENISTTQSDTAEEMSVNRTRSGGFIAWPK
jgi:hypothetical protein